MSKRRYLALAICVMLLATALFGCTPTPTSTPSSTAPASQAPASSEPQDADPGDAGDYPNKPIQLVVPVKPGGDTDTNARILAKYLTEELGQNVIVVNTEGGSGSTGMKAVMDASPDGYNALFFHTEALLPKLAGMVDYDLFDFKMAGISLMDDTTVLATHKDSGFSTIDEFVVMANENPGALQFGMATGGYPHVIGLALADVLDVDINIVDVGGNADKTTALLGHKVDIINIQYGLVEDYFENGDFVCLGLLSEERNPLMPEVPTLKEQGYELVFNKSFFTAFPIDTPDAIRDVMSGAIEAVCQNPDFIEEMASYYINAEYLAPAEATAYMHVVSDIFNNYQEVLAASVQ